MKIGGQLTFKELTKSLDVKVYAQAKAICWMRVLNDMWKPTRFLQPTKNGTKLM